MYHLYTIIIYVYSSQTVLEHHRYHPPICNGQAGVSTKNHTALLSSILLAVMDIAFLTANTRSWLRTNVLILAFLAMYSTIRACDFAYQAISLFNLQH